MDTKSVPTQRWDNKGSFIIPGSVDSLWLSVRCHADGSWNIAVQSADMHEAQTRYQLWYPNCYSPNAVLALWQAGKMPTRLGRPPLSNNAYFVQQPQPQLQLQSLWAVQQLQLNLTQLQGVRRQKNPNQPQLNQLP